ncbi:hypothetical protein [Shewanella sp. UCD-KL12]|uniref:hypothetical protein n=1 Tax=Shewanella sp. UCD-KL12 TaxID=1917163 RepID=UPI00097137F4|nr:hypothetical protein [Shewanella sp. UCD-KL12]
MTAKPIKLFISVFFSLLTTSCVFTEALWRESSYDESFASFLISEDNKNLVIIGEKYHYVIKPSETLVNILKSSYKPNIQGHFDYFKVEANDNIKGTYSLTFNAIPSEATKEWLNANDFKVKEHKKLGDKFVFQGNISGVRYLPSESVNNTFSFNKAYSVSIYEEISTAGQAYRTALSPISVALDGTLAIGGMALFITACTGKRVTTGKGADNIC